MNRFKSEKEWAIYMINKNYDVSTYTIVENAISFLKRGTKKFSEYSDDELENAEIV